MLGSGRRLGGGPANRNCLTTRGTRNLLPCQFIWRQELLPASACDWEWHNISRDDLPKTRIGILPILGGRTQTVCGDIFWVFRKPRSVVMMSAGTEDSLLTEVREIARQLTAELSGLLDQAASWRNPEDYYPQVARALDCCRDRLAALQLPGEANRLPSSELWRIAGSILELGWLQNRARTKPRGYAGDFEMLARICDEWRSEDPLGRLFDQYFQSEAAPQAVRNRTQLMARLIATQCQQTDGPFHAVSVGSGPGEDLRRAAEMLPPPARLRLRVTLLDIDPDALEYASQRLSAMLQPTQVSTRRENLFRLSKNRRLGSELAGAQLVYCTGLFDYLSVAEGGALLRTMWSWLAPGGQTLAFNFTLPNPTRTYMEWIGNWYLTYRTREELADLADVAGIPASAVALGAEATGVNLYLQAQRS